MNYDILAWIWVAGIILNAIIVTICADENPTDEQRHAVGMLALMGILPITWLIWPIFIYGKFFYKDPQKKIEEYMSGEE